MYTRRQWVVFLALAVSAAAFAGCGKSGVKGLDETLSLPFRGVKAGVRGIGKGAGAIGEAGGDIFSRQLETKRIPSGVGTRMYSGLEGVRQSLNLFRQRHNTPRYTGFIAVR